jgi:hypothetical protein
MQRERVRWLVILVTAGAAGCNFDPTRTCQTSADCVNGATCDPGTNTCVQGGPSVVLEISVSDPPARANSGSLTVLDPGFGADAGAAFRRDESATVTVTSGSTSVDAGSVQVTVTGVGAGAAPVVVQPLVPCVGSASAFCVQGTVSFGPPLPLEAFRGAVTVTATGADNSGSAAAPATATVLLTRWKWAVQLGGPIRTSPSVGATGRIYVGTDAPDGRFQALTPEGVAAWTQPLDGGAFVATAAVGAGGASETVYAASAETGHCAAFAVSGATGAVTRTCDFPATTGGGFLGSLALVQTNGVESGTGICNDTTVGVDGQLITVRPSAPSVLRCRDDTSAGLLDDRASLASSGANQAFAGTSAGVLRGFVFSGNDWSPNTWGGGSGGVFVGAAAIGALGIDGNAVLSATRSRGAFAVDRASGNSLGSAPDGGLSTNPGSIVIAPDGVLFGNGDTSNPQLLKAVVTNSTATAVPASGAIVAAPLLAAAPDAGVLLYDVTQNGYLEVRNGALATAWTEQLVTTGGFLASPNADCRRSDAGTPSTAAPGILYLASTTGQVFAIFTDSVGLDTRAPWPRYQHDARSTGNSTTPLTQCP